jgi:serine/threonine-protein phosphatase 4 regulatory subunit 1
MQTIFVNEVDRVGHDHVYWVRREASFAVGALAKVVPLELVLSSLVSRQNTPCVHFIDTFIVTFIRSTRQ